MKNDHEQRRPAGLSETLANLIGEAAADIRQRVVEEGWFGRPTTVGRESYEEFWSDRVSPSDTPSREKDQSIDR